jgi:Zn-dependent protease
MMRGWHVGTIRGIAIEINYTWIIMFVLFTFVFASMLHPVAPDQPVVQWVGGAIACLFFVASVLAHELCHSLVALSLGISVRRITLFVFGGVSQVEGEVHTPGGEFLMSIAGPASSAALALIFYFLGGRHWNPSNAPDMVSGVIILLAYINGMLAIFNMLPGLPLDGGRVLHSIIWAISHNEYSSTRLASALGVALGIGLMAWGGFLALFVPGGQMGLWAFFIGWLILSVARGEGQQAELKQVLKGLQVGQVMHWPVPSIPADANLAAAVQEYAAVRPQPLYPVVDARGVAVGVLEQTSLQKYHPAEWAQVTVSQVMQPLEPERMTIGLHAAALEALSKMAQNGLGWLMVTSVENQPIGLLTEHGIMAAAGHRHGPAVA